MSIKYETLLGDATADLDGADIQQLIVENLYLPNGAEKGLILTSDDQGLGTWQEVPDAELIGDATGHASGNVVNTLAGGTISVSNLVQINGIVNNINPANGKVLTCTDDLGSSNWQPLPEAELFGDATGLVSKTIVNTLAGGTIPVSNLVQVNGIVNNIDAVSGKVLTCTDNLGSSSWQDVPDAELFGDATGFASKNIVNTLADGTIPVSSLVQINGIVNNVDAASGKVLTCTDDLGSSSWQEVPTGAALAGDAAGPASANVVNTLAGGTISVSNLVQINGIVNNVDAASGKVLTCADGVGSSSWQPLPDTELIGDAAGHASGNIVNTLAGGTIPVSTLVQVNGIVNNVSAASGKVLTCTDGLGSSSWQFLPTPPPIQLFSGVWNESTTYQTGNRVRFNASKNPAHESLYTTFPDTILPINVDYYQLALIMEFQLDGFVSAARFYLAPNVFVPSFDVIIQFWSSAASDPIATVVGSPHAVVGWHTIAFPSPIAVTAGVRYAISLICWHWAFQSSLPPASPNIIPITGSLQTLGGNVDNATNPCTAGADTTDVYAIDMIYTPTLPITNIATIYISLTDNNVGNRPKDTIGVNWQAELTGFDDF